MSRLKPYYADRVDMWCCGIMLLTMITRRVPPWQQQLGARGAAALEAATSGRIRAIPAIRDHHVDDDRCWDLVEWMLRADPLARPTALDALAHAWIAGAP